MKKDKEVPKRIRTTSEMQKARGEVPITEGNWLSLAEYRQLYPRADKDD